MNTMSSVHADMMRLLKQMENPYLHHIDLHLSRMERIMEALGHPERDLPPTVHVAGTNGKGSLMAYLRAIYEAAEKPVHVYTSPHLVRFNERIVLAGKEVEDAELHQALQKVHRLREQFPVTLFEGVTAAAFQLFAKHPAEALLLEVGLGGRLDATNVIDKPAVSVITPVSLDHMEFLGDSVIQIAREKAGIIKPGVPCVVGPQEPDALGEVMRRAEAVGAPLYRYGFEWRLRQEDGKHFYHSETLTLELPQPSLYGAHQWANAATAVAVIDILRQNGQIDCTDAHIRQGIQSAVWSGRLQQLHSPRWLSLLPEGSEVWLDGGHNPAAGKVLATWIQERWGEEARIQLVCGMVRSKDVKGFLGYLTPFAEHVWAVPIHDEPRAIMPGELQHKAASMGVESSTAHHVPEALAAIGRTHKEPVKVLITGSLYLAGVVLVEGL